VPFDDRGEGILIVGTDGLFKYTTPTKLCTTARTPELDAVPARLVELVRLRSGNLQDDIAVVACRLTG